MQDENNNRVLEVDGEFDQELEDLYNMRGAIGVEGGRQDDGCRNPLAELLIDGQQNEVGPVGLLQVDNVEELNIVAAPGLRFPR